MSWAYQDMDTFDCRGHMHAKKPRYFGDVWKFFPKHLQGSDIAWEVEV